MNNQPVILSAVRTPVGKFLGALSPLSATELGALVVRESVSRAGVPPDAVEEVILGNVISAGLGQSPARQAAIRGGIPDKAAALNINKVCGSGLKAVGLAAQAIQCGDAEVIVAGGMESMSNAPHLLPKLRDGYRLGNGQMIDSVVFDGLTDAFHNCHMGCTGEAVAEKYGVTREQQDEYAYYSHRKALAAMTAGYFKAEILPVALPAKKGQSKVVDQDEAPRADISLEAMRALKPVFQADGTVTAANAPGMNDGAAALVVTSEAYAARQGSKVLARIVAQAASGIEPMMVMMAPVAAVEKLLKKAGWTREQVDLFELNEAFSVQAVALIQELGLDPAKVNVNGGAVALGHPIGASGARILTTLLYEMQRRDVRRGVAALCLGGGNAFALAVER